MGRMRFDPRANAIVVPAMVTGLGDILPKGLHLVFDSGASLTTLPWEFLISLGYDPEASRRRRRVVTGSSVEYAPIVEVRALSAFNETVEDLEVLCHDLPEAAQVDGLLGMNFLRHFDVHILFSKGILELRRIK